MMTNFPTVWLVHNLSSGDQDVIMSSLRRPAECSLKREGLHAVVKLLKDPRSKVLTAAHSLLRTLAAQPKQREQVMHGWMDGTHCTERDHRKSRTER